jgi:hypothetical protein
VTPWQSRLSTTSSRAATLLSPLQDLAELAMVMTARQTRKARNKLVLKVLRRKDYLVSIKLRPGRLHEPRRGSTSQTARDSSIQSATSEQAFRPPQSRGKNSKDHHNRRHRSLFADRLECPASMESPIKRSTIPTRLKKRLDRLSRVVRPQSQVCQVGQVRPTRVRLKIPTVPVSIQPIPPVVRAAFQLVSTRRSQTVKLDQPPLLQPALLSPGSALRPASSMGYWPVMPRTVMMMW